MRVGDTVTHRATPHWVGKIRRMGKFTIYVEWYKGRRRPSYEYPLNIKKIDVIAALSKLQEEHE